MLNDKPFIHTFNVLDNYYMYDVNKNAILKIKKNIYNFLRKMLSNDAILNKDDYKDEYKFMDELKNHGYLSTKRFKEIVHPLDPILPHILQNKINMIILQVTQQCNFRCKYCVYSDDYETREYTNKSMNVNTAKKGIDFLLNHSLNSESIHIAFYGGEPLLKFDLIKECVEYAKEQAEGKKVSFNMTTNASLLTDEILEYLIKNDIELMVSLDGPKNVHDKNRILAGNNCGTFDKVIKTLEMIKTKYPNYYDKKVLLSAVIDSECNFEDVTKFFMDCSTVKDMMIISALINDRYRTDEIEFNDDFISKYAYETFKIYLNKLKRLDDKSIPAIFKLHSGSLDSTFKKFSQPENGLKDKGHPSGPCIPGSKRLFMDTDGNLYPCEKVSEASEVAKIGHIDTGFDIEKARTLLNLGKLTEEQCRNCWAYRYCDICASAADGLTKLSPEKKLSYCASTKTNVEGLMKDYCTLKEFGYTPEDEAPEEISVYDYV